MASYYSHESIDHAIRGQKGPDFQSSELDIFSTPSYQREIESSFFEEIYCHEGGLDNTQNEVIFTTKPTIELISLVDSYVTATVQIQKKKVGGGSESPTAAEKVNAANNVLYNLWKDFRISLNGTEIQTTHQLYFLETYIILLLNLSSDSYKKWEPCGYYGDEKVTQTDPTG